MADIYTCAKFGVEKLRGQRYTEVQTLVSATETADHPYSRAACDCYLTTISRSVFHPVSEALGKIETVGGSCSLRPEGPKNEAVGREL